MLRRKKGENEEQNLMFVHPTPELRLGDKSTSECPSKTSQRRTTTFTTNRNFLRSIIRNNNPENESLSES